MARAEEDVDTGTGEPVDVAVNLGSRLRVVRLRSGLSLREVARQLGVSPSFVSQLENGKSRPSVATLYSLSQLLDVSIDQLFAPESTWQSPEADNGDGPHVTNGRSPRPASAGTVAAGQPAAAPAETRQAGARQAGAGQAEAWQAGPGQAGAGQAEAWQADAMQADARRAGDARPATQRAATHGRASPARRHDDRGTVSRTDLGSPGDAWTKDQAMPPLSVTGPGARPRLVMDSGVIWEQLARNTDPTIDFIEIIYPPGSSSTTDERMLRHEGYEYGYLLAGELDVVYGFTTFTLRAGESLGLDSSVPHLFRNVGSVPARGIWFVHRRRTRSGGPDA